MVHGVEDAALYRLESIFYMGHSTLQNYVRSIIEVPVSIHAPEVVCSHGRMIDRQAITGFGKQIGHR